MPSHSVAAVLRNTAPDIALIYGYELDDSFDVVIRFHSAQVSYLFFSRIHYLTDFSFHRIYQKPI